MRPHSLNGQFAAIFVRSYVGLYDDGLNTLRLDFCIRFVGFLFASAIINRGVPTPRCKIDSTSRADPRCRSRYYRYFGHALFSYL